jgi:hypothetical protein
MRLLVSIDTSPGLAFDNDDNDNDNDDDNDDDDDDDDDSYQEVTDIKLLVILIDDTIIISGSSIV